MTLSCALLCQLVAFICTSSQPINAQSSWHWLPIPCMPVAKTYPLLQWESVTVDQYTHVSIAFEPRYQQDRVELVKQPQMIIVALDAPEQRVSLSFMCAWCAATSSAMAAVIISLARTQFANIEVLDIIKLNDGDAFRGGEDQTFYPPMPQIDRETRWRASSARQCKFLTLINRARPRETSSQGEQIEARNSLSILCACIEISL